VDSWKDNRIEARSAVIVTRQEDPTQIFGIVSINARTEVDRETRLVSFEDITIKDVNFPSAPALRSTLLEAARSNVPNWPRTVSLDRLLADLEITQAEAKAESIRLKNNPLNIIFSQGSAVLILIDGEPVYHPVEGTRYTRVVNTPALLLFDSSAGAFYLDDEQMVDDSFDAERAVDRLHESAPGSGGHQAAAYQGRRKGAGRPDGQDTRGKPASRLCQHGSRRVGCHTRPANVCSDP